jgi:hypothetical protein
VKDILPVRLVADSRSDTGSGHYKQGAMRMSTDMTCILSYTGTNNSHGHSVSVLHMTFIPHGR